MPSAALPRRRSHSAMLALLTLVTALVAWPQPAWAHTEFASSEPTDGQAVEGPLDRVTVTFTDPASPSGEGFAVLDSSGEPVAATTETNDGKRFTLVFETPLAAGDYGVRWEVRAGDAHPISGSFRFSVVEGPGGSGGKAGTPDPGGSALDDALEPSEAAAGDVVAGIARFLTFAGVLVGLGAVACLAWVLRGQGRELRAVLIGTRFAGVAIVVGAAVEALLLTSAEPGGITDLWNTSTGTAATLRLVGGIAVAVGLRTSSTAPTAKGAVPGDALLQWRPTRASAPAIAGFALVLASFWLDGHTVTRGPWPLHAAVNLVHLLAAAVWAGGVLVTAILVWWRRLHGRPGDGAWLVIRFSPIAAVSLTAVVLAGAAMAVIVLQTPADLLGTQWGRVLLAKTAVVAVAAAMGAVNHRRLKPALERDPENPALAQRVRRTLAIESIALAAVVALTAWLVGAAT